MENEMQQELLWEEDLRTPKQKMQTPVIVLSILLAIVMLALPLIIYDILGAGAYYFEANGKDVVQITSLADGNSTATFFFGLAYTLSHLQRGFIPLQLFTAQWMALTDAASVSPLSTALGVVTLVLTVALFVTAAAAAVIYIVDKRSEKPGVHLLTKRFSTVAFAVQAVTFLWLLILVVGLALKIEPTHQIFNFQDFMVYGGIKLAAEALLTLPLCILNGLICRYLRQHPEEYEV